MLLFRKLRNNLPGLWKFLISIFIRGVTCPTKVPAADAQLRHWKALINGPGGAQHSAASSFTVLIRRVMGRRRLRTRVERAQRKRKLPYSQLPNGRIAINQSFNQLIYMTDLITMQSG